MQKYRTLHLWMIIPMILMQLGIFMDYWGDFTDNAWSVHIHYWTGTIWYVYLIIQPYYATHGQLEKHRTNGIIGMFLAGGVTLTALSMMYRDIRVADLALAEPDRFGPFKPWLFFGIASIEIIMMTAFGFAIIMSIIKRKSLEDHAWWLISSVFLIMMPALGRGLQGLFIMGNMDAWPKIDIITPIYIAQALIILILLLTAWKYNKLKHPATIVGVAVNLFCCFIVPLGQSEGIQSFLRMVIKE
jgi:ABC-type uncharacterized transport system permease subunit